MSSLCSIVSDVMSDNPAVTSTTDCFLLSPRASACQLVMGIEPNPNRTRTLLIVEPNWTRTLYSAEQNRTSCRYCHFYFSNITCNRDDVGVGKHSTSVLSATRRSPDPIRPKRRAILSSKLVDKDPVGRPRGGPMFTHAVMTLIILRLWVLLDAKILCCNECNW